MNIDDGEELPVLQKLSAKIMNFRLGTTVNSGTTFELTEANMQYGALVTGSTGSGKTLGVMQRVLQHILLHPSKPGALVINLKDNYGEFLLKEAGLIGQTDRIVILEPGGTARMNILNPEFSPHKLATLLFGACLAPGEMREPRHAYWLHQGLRVLDILIGLARASMGVDVATLVDVQALATEFTDIRENKAGNSVLGEDVGILLGAIEEKVLRLPPNHPDYRRLVRETTQFRNETRRLAALDLAPRSSILAELDRVLLALRPDEISQVMCARPDDVTFQGVQEIIDDGKIVILDFAPQKHGLGGQILAKGLKRQLFDLLVRRRGNSASASDRPVYFLADEYQFFLDIDQSETSDNNFSSIARSLNCRLWISTQEANALYAAAGYEGEAMVSNLVRNLRVQIHLRQNFTRQFGEMLEERGVPASTAYQFPTLPKFTALILHDDVGHKLVKLSTSKSFFDPLMDREQAALTQMRDGTISNVLSLASGVQSPTSYSRKILISGKNADDVCGGMDFMESALQEKNVPVIRLHADRFADGALPFLIISQARNDLRFSESGVLLIDRLDLVPPGLEGLRSLRTVGESKFIDLGLSEFRFDLTRIRILTSWVHDSESACLGFRPNENQSSRLSLPKIIQNNFQVVRLDEKRELRCLRSESSKENAACSPFRRHSS